MTPTHDSPLPDDAPAGGDATDAGRRATGGLALVGSIITCTFVTLQLMVAIAAMVFILPSFTEIFEDFDAELPTLTAMVLRVPPVLAVVVGLGLVALVVLKEFVLRNAMVKLTINLVLMVALLAAVPVLVFALFLPMVQLLESTM